MLGSAIIVFREVLEAALVIGIVLAASRGIASSRAWIAAGAGVGLAGAAAVAGVADAIAAGFEGIGQELLNAGILLVAVLMLAWHSIWMSSHGAAIARELKSIGGQVAQGSQPVRVLALVVALAVLREGSEVVLFLYGIAAGGTNAASLWGGVALGLAAGVLAGSLMYQGLLRIPARHLFAVTGWLIVLLAAGLAGQAAAYLVQAGVVPAIIDPIWDTSGLLPEQSAPGQLLRVLVGYDDRPTAMQVAWFLLTLASIVTIGALVNRRPSMVPRASGALVLLAGVLPGIHAGRAEAAHVVYSPIVEGGEKAVELRGHYDFDGDEERDGSQKYKVDLEWAPTSRWLTELVTEFESAGGEDLETTEIAWENIFQLTEQGQYWADFGLLAEYAYSLEDDGEDKLEIGLLGQKEAGQHVTTANLVFERELGGEGDTETEYAVQYRYRLSERLEPGVEFYGELGEVDDMGSLDEHEHQAGPVLLGKFRTDRAAWKYELGVLFGLTGETPDTTVRFLLEFEF